MCKVRCWPWWFGNKIPTSLTIKLARSGVEPRDGRQGLELRVEGLGFGVQGVAFRVLVVGCRVRVHSRRVDHVTRPTASERRRNTVNTFKDFDLQVKASIWP